MTPITSVLRASSSGVPPLRAMRSICGERSADGVPPCSRTQASTESGAPLRIFVPSARSSPLMRVYALNGTKIEPAGASPSRAPTCWASATIERPSGVSSASDER